MHRIEDILEGLKKCRAADICSECQIYSLERCIDSLHEDAEQLIRALMKENAELREQRFVGKHERRSGTEVKAYVISKEWALTSKGFIRTEYLKEEGTGHGD